MNNISFYGHSQFINVQTINKSILPEYLYHFTNESNAKSILESGKIVTYQDGRNLDLFGVFMVDLQNLVNGWKNFLLPGNIDLLTCLLGQVAKGESKITCFKIPIKNRQQCLQIRSQKVLLDDANVGKNNDLCVNVEQFDTFKKNNEPIEFICTSDIPLAEVEQIPPVELPQELVSAFNELEGVDFKSLTKVSIEFLRKLFTNNSEASKVM